jgi:hypothetical protein
VLLLARHTPATAQNTIGAVLLGSLFCMTYVSISLLRGSTHLLRLVCGELPVSKLMSTFESTTIPDCKSRLWVLCLALWIIVVMMYALDHFSLVSFVLGRYHLARPSHIELQQDARYLQLSTDCILNLHLYNWHHHQSNGSGKTSLVSANETHCSHDIDSYWGLIFLYPWTQ